MSSQTIKYQVRFTESVDFRGNKLEYSDALYFDVLPKQEEIDKLKAERVETWLAVLNAPPVELTKEQEIAQAEDELVQMVEQEQVWVARKQELQTKVATLTAVADVKPIAEELIEDKP